MKNRLKMLRLAVGEEPSFMLRFKNFGLTPAYKVGVVRSIMSGPWPLPDNVELTSNSVESGVQTLAPGAVTFGGSTPHKGGDASVVTDGEMAQLRSGERRMYIYGQLTYVDAFNQDRFTNFCLCVVPPQDPAAAQFGVQRCPCHNDAN